MHLRHYRFCISCGLDNNKHPTDDVLKCITLRNGKFRKQFGPMIAYDPIANKNDLAFNLDTHEEFWQFQQRDPNYPTPIALKFCPYCGREYNIDYR
jgi:hypothetical protein